MDSLALQERRLGIFTLTYTQVLDLFTVAATLPQVKVVSMHWDFVNDVAVCAAMYELFDYVPYGQVIPTYKFIINTDPQAASKYQFEKVEN